MQGEPAVVLVVPLEHGKVDHPQRRPVTPGQAAFMANLEAQRPHGLIHHLGLVGAEEHQVAGFGAHAVHDGQHGVRRQELDDGRLQTLDAGGAVRHLDVGQTLGAIDADELGQVVDFLARQLGALGQAQGHHPAIRVLGRTGEDLEFDILQQVSDVGQFQRNTQVRLVGTIAAHGFGMRQARERIGQLDVQGFLEQVADHCFHQVGDGLLVHEGSLDVELGEFRLPVGAQVLVTEAPHHLVIPVHASDHQQLLVKLWRLRQGKEMVGMGAAGNQVVAGAFRGGLGQEGRLDFIEAVIVHEIAEMPRDVTTQSHALLHDGPTQVDVAITQAGFLADLDLALQGKGRRLGSVEDFE